MFYHKFLRNRRIEYMHTQEWLFQRLNINHCYSVASYPIGINKIDEQHFHCIPISFAYSGCELHINRYWLIKTIIRSI